MPAKLILCNGAYKSGSTWTYNIVMESLDTSSFDKKYLDKYLNEGLDISMLNEFSREIKDGIFVSKSHEEDPKKVMSFREGIDIKVIMIDRDPRSVFLSYYHHITNSIGFKIPYVIFYSLLGKYKLCEISSYNNKWRDENDIDILWVSFEELKIDPQASIKKICSFIDDSAINNYDLISKRTSLNSLRSKQKTQFGKSFFRAGEISEWKKALSKSFSSKIFSDYSNPSKITKIITYILFHMRRKLTQKKTFFLGAQR